MPDTYVDWNDLNPEERAAVLATPEGEIKEYSTEQGWWVLVDRRDPSATPKPSISTDAHPDWRDVLNMPGADGQPLEEPCGWDPEKGYCPFLGCEDCGGPCECFEEEQPEEMSEEPLASVLGPLEVVPPDRSNPRWLSVYGAAVALQALNRIRDGLGPADDERMSGIVEEATAIADHAEESYQNQQGDNA